MRLIDADALMKEFTEFVKDSNNSDFADVPVWNDAVSLVGSAPTIEERKSGKWRKSYADHEAFGIRPFFRYCSECHEATVYPYNFCPNCGADMRGEE